MKENEDYELVPIEEDLDAWGIRFLKGDFIETVVKFGVLQLIEETENISFNFDIISSPDENLTVDNEELQKVVSDILYVIITESMEKDASKS
tara:strand:- start:1061 stop:1336 length:276 start_codon:yes stop_codon:yes gene_type:complete